MRRVFTTIFCIFMLLPISTSLAAVCGDVTGLTPGAPDGQVNVLDIIYLINYKFKSGPEPDCGTITDVDGNVYQTITIGNQVWMAENLKVTHYRNGDPIPNVTGSSSWSDLSTGAFCEYGNDINNVATYGRLYNWYAVNDSRNIAPSGWHVPSDAEWQTLVDYLGGANIAGVKMKEAGTVHWNSPNLGATNESGFSALPGGHRNTGGSFLERDLHAYFWSSTEFNSYASWDRAMSYLTSQVYQYYYDKRYGFSVRCVKD